MIGTPLTIKQPASVSGTPKDCTTWPSVETRPGPVPGFEELAQLSRESHLSLGLAPTPVMPGLHAPLTQPNAMSACMRRWPPRADARPAAAGRACLPPLPNRVHHLHAYI